MRIDDFISFEQESKSSIPTRRRRWRLDSGLTDLLRSTYVDAEEPQRQSEVAQRGAEVMPFSLGATTHIFSKTSDGGTQRVVAKNPADKTQVRLIREHLRSIGEQFRNGDFSAPSQIHGDDMPGLAQLKAAKPGQISMDYKDVRAGGQLTFRTRDTTLVVALHEWYGAQLSDHDPDAIEGHQQHHGGMQTQ
ncbi:aspartate carbamoyltransferase [Caballeronia sp. INML1]|uniref:aspartate carbamoyltransferase n=1 Tax=Caballeronia sp. INML1 TaxID=2921760 RepID=UPI0020295761|nr:aspartate carbamoyltransferase [Caballeronia sp. INML1]